MENQIIRLLVKTKLLNSAHLLCLLGAFLLPINPCARAQTNFCLKVQMIGGQPGLTITGAVGLVCEIQYASHLAQPNPWRFLTNLTLPSNPYLWLDRTAAGVAQRFYRALTTVSNSAPPNMVLIPAGSFTMGDTFNDWPPESGANPEVPAHLVAVSAFYMDRYDVTKALWDEVYHWAITHGYIFDSGAQGKAANHPAHSMTWYDAVKWCNARSEKEGRVGAYYTDAGLTVVYKTGQVPPYVKWSSGYRLPTEAEWEKAKRGGASGRRFPWGNTISWSQANYYSYWPGGVPLPYDVNPMQGYHPTFNDGVPPYTSPVDYFAPNGYGLYDMAGNVGQWCWDWEGAYSDSPQTDPRGPAAGAYRVIRGGSWYFNAFGCRTANRSSDYPIYGSNRLGFRSVLPPGQ